jgi:hypothetical protein
MIIWPFWKYRLARVKTPNIGRAKIELKQQCDVPIAEVQNIQSSQSATFAQIV